jgi:hypothetical protein
VGRVVLQQMRDVTGEVARKHGMASVHGVKVVLDGLTVSNQGWSWSQLEQVGGFM